MTESLRGRFLIAGKRLQDPNFCKSVVLLVEHGPDGAMGIIVNRPSTVTVANALSDHFQLPPTDDLVYIGGPVEPSALFILHNRDEFHGNENSIVPGLFVGNSPDIFESVVRSSTEDETDMQFRIYCGCAGWGPGQLEDEMDRGDWFLLNATAESLFQDDPYEVWDDLRCKVHVSPSIVPDFRGNPECN